MHALRIHWKFFKFSITYSLHQCSAPLTRPFLYLSPIETGNKERDRGGDCCHQRHSSSWALCADDFVAFAHNAQIVDKAWSWRGPTGIICFIEKLPIFGVDGREAHGMCECDGRPEQEAMLSYGCDFSAFANFADDEQTRYGANKKPRNGLEVFLVVFLGVQTVVSHGNLRHV